MTDFGFYGIKTDSDKQMMTVMNFHKTVMDYTQTDIGLCQSICPIRYTHNKQTRGVPGNQKAVPSEGEVNSLQR